MLILFGLSREGVTFYGRHLRSVRRKLANDSPYLIYREVSGLETSVGISQTIFLFLDFEGIVLFIQGKPTAKLQNKSV